MESYASDEPSAEEIEHGRRLFARPCRFLTGVARLEQLPPADLTEIAFAGRSNVGKSSLVNALTGRKTLARTSNTPGRTRQLNFFSLDDRLILVDLPGYGYARVSKSEVTAWTRTLRDYLRGRVPLRQVCLLIDARHGIKPNDREMMDLLDETAVIYRVILTKVDKLRDDALERCISDTADVLRQRPAAHPHIAATSAIRQIGIPQLRAMLSRLAT